MQSPSLLEDLRSRIHQAAHRTAPAIVDQNFDRAEFALDSIVRSCDIRLDRGVAPDWQRDASGRLDLIRRLPDDLWTPGDEPHFVGCSKAQRQRHPETLADADHHANLV
jgi:hypothetical protein